MVGTKFSREVLILLSLFPFFTLAKDVEIWNLDDLSLESYQEIKKIPQQAVYRASNCFIKIWNSVALQFEYNRNQAFYEAVLGGVFDDIAPITALIVSNALGCCGYATEPCRTINVDIAHIRQVGSSGLSDQDSLLVTQLFARMRKKTEKYGFCFTDLASSNLGILDGMCYFIDLDGFWDLELYKRTHGEWLSALFYMSPKFLEKGA